MDDFREWLSDNLRYFMLGGAILLIVLVLFFGIRACTKKSGSSTESDSQETSVTITDESSGAAAASSSDNPLVSASGDIVALMKSYYTALGEKDIETLRTLVDDLTPTDEAKIANSNEYIESYEVGDVYTKDGLDSSSKVVYVCFKYICNGVKTPVPALSRVYVIKDSAGNLKIDASAETDTQISQYMAKLQEDQDVKDLIAKVQADYDAALASDSELANFLAGLGEEADTASSSGESSDNTMIANTDANVRDYPNGDILGALAEGDEVTVLGREDDWVKISFDGGEAYVFGELLDSMGGSSESGDSSGSGEESTDEGAVA